MSLRFILGTRVIDVDPISQHFEAFRITRSEKRRFGIKPCAVCASYNLWVAPVPNWTPEARRSLDLLTFRAGIRCGRCGRLVGGDTMTEVIGVWNFRRPGKRYPAVPGPRKRRKHGNDSQTAGGD